MNGSRRRFLGFSAAMLGTAPALAEDMPHIVLLGDSVFDNASYVGGKPDVVAQVRAELPAGWKATLLAVDGATTEGIPTQLARLPSTATQLVLSVGGNNALMKRQILEMPVKSSADAFTLLAEAVQEFEAAYRKAIAACRKTNLPLIICTIYNGNFPEPAYRRRVAVAIAAFNDAIIRTAAENRLSVIELRQVCDKPEDYANPIEPSHVGGAKIAKVIAREAAAAEKRGKGMLPGAVIVGP